MTKVSILGVAIGVATLIVVLSIMGGLESNLRTKMFKGMPHIELRSEDALLGFSLQEVSLKSLKQKPWITELEPFIQNDVVIKKGKILAPMTLLGLDPSSGGKPWGFSKHMIEGSLENLDSPFDSRSKNSSLPGIILGESLARRLGASTLDLVTTVSLDLSTGSILSGQKISTLFEVRGIFYTGLAKYDSQYALTGLSSARKFMPEYDASLDEEKFVTGLALLTKEPEKVEFYSQNLKKELELETRTWKDANKSIIFALKLEKYTMASILFLIVLVAGFSISGTLMMSVFYKKNQISLLRSLGLSRRSVLFIHLLQGLLIGFAGGILGLSLGIGACFFLDSNLLSSLLPNGFHSFLRLIPIRFLWFEYLFIALSAWVLSLLAALYPALLASKQAPTEGLRYL